MRKLSTALIVGTSLLIMPSSASAGNSSSYESNITSLPAGSIRIEVSLSEKLEGLAESHADGRQTCSIAKSVKTNGFACGGQIGFRDLYALTEKIESNTTRKLEKKNFTITEDADFILKLVLVDAKNNRPTQRQLSYDQNLSFKSISLGGAEFKGELLTKDGTSLGTMSYAYYDRIFNNFIDSKGKWTDANESIQKFSKRIAKDLAKRRKNNS